MGLLERMNEELKKAKEEGKTSVLLTGRNEWGPEWPPAAPRFDVRYLNDTDWDAFVYDPEKGNPCAPSSPPSS
jgi:hypothetical protein